MTTVRLGKLTNGKFKELKHESYSPIKFNDWEVDGETLTIKNASPIMFRPIDESWGMINAVMVESGMISKAIPLKNPVIVKSISSIEFSPGQIEMQLQ